MPNQDADPQAQLPGSTMTPRQVRILKIVVIAMGVLLLAGFALVVVTIVYQATQLGNDENVAAQTANVPVNPPASALPVETMPANSATSASIELSRDARVTSSTVDGSRLILTLEDDGAITILVLDTTNWTLVHRHHITRAP